MVVRIKLAIRSLIIVAIYLRPNSIPASYTAHTNAIQALCDMVSDTDIILALGDYNLPNLQWQFDEDINGYLPTNASTEQDVILTESFSTSGLIQLNSISNSNGRILDLAYANTPDYIELIDPPLPLIKMDDHHKPFILRLDTRYTSPCFDNVPMDDGFRLQAM